MRELFYKYCDLIGLENEGFRRLNLLILIIYISPQIITEGDILYISGMITDKILRLIDINPDFLIITFYIPLSFVEYSVIVKFITWIKDGFKKT